MIENKEFRMLNPRLDGTFKAIFTQDTDDSRNALKSFLSAMIGRTVTEVTVRENEPSQNFEGQKGIRYDINCIFDNNTRAQVEIQGLNRKYDYGKRAEYYVARLVSSIAVKGDDWNDLPKAYQITLMDFKYDKSNEEPLHRYTLTDINDGSKLSDTINVIFLELPKLPLIDDKTDIKTLPSVIKWGTFFKEADNPKRQKLIGELVKTDGGIMCAEKTLDKISEDGWRWFDEAYNQSFRIDQVSSMNACRREGIIIGEERGINASKIANAKNLLAMKVLSHEQIAQAVELPLDKIEELAKEIEAKA